MRHQSDFESADQVVAATGASKPQLVRWHRAGLLPRPLQRGLGRGRGTESIYPIGTTGLVLDLCAIRKHERRLSVVAWHLWWSGHDALTKGIRRSLQQLAAEWERLLKRWVQNGDLTDDGLSLIDQAEEPRIRGKALRRIRRRVGYRRMSTFMRVATEVVSGTFGNWRDLDDPDILSRGLRPPKGGQTPDALNWIRDPIALRELSQRISSGAICRSVDRTTDEDLVRARNTIRALFPSSSIISSLGLSAISEDLAEDLWGQKALVLAWIVFQSKRGVNDDSR